MSSTDQRINLELLEDLLEFEPQRADGREVDLADPPTNAEGTLVCGRRRKDGQRCGKRVSIPWVPCETHPCLRPVI